MKTYIIKKTMVQYIKVEANNREKALEETYNSGAPYKVLTKTEIIKQLEDKKDG